MNICVTCCSQKAVNTVVFFHYNGDIEMLSQIVKVHIHSWPTNHTLHNQNVLNSHVCIQSVYEENTDNCYCLSEGVKSKS